MKLSIIILSYNTRDLLENCLESIYKHLPKEIFELIVLDNNSKDGSIEMVKKIYPQAKLICSDKNLGFAKGVNLGVKRSSGDYLLFLNSDTILKDNSLLNMLEFIKGKVEVGIIGGLLVNADSSIQRSYGNFYNLTNTFKMLLFGDKSEIEDKKKLYIKKVDWISGGFMMIKREIFEKLGGFDENFFMYMEDMELCYRANKLGYSTYLYPQATVIHLHHGSSSRSFAIENIYKGLLYFFKKHRNNLEYQAVKTALWIKALILIIGGNLLGNKYLKETYNKAIRF